MKKSIFLIINSLFGGGAEKLNIELANAVEIEKVLIIEKDISYKNLLKEKILILSSIKEKDSVLSKYLILLLITLKLTKVFSKNDIVISSLHRSDIVNIFSSIFTRHKKILWLHSSLDIYSHSIFAKFNRLLFSNFDYLVFNSENGKRIFKRNYVGINDKKLTVIYNFFDMKRIIEDSFHILDKDTTNLFKYPTIISTGRLEKVKGHYHLLKSFALLKEKQENVKLLILGDGSLHKSLVEFCKNLNLKVFKRGLKLTDDYDIYFLGFQKNPFAFYRKASLLAFSSISEGFGNVIVEAMACGTPIVSVDCFSGPREILAPKTDFSKQTENLEFAEFGILTPIFEGEINFENLEPSPSEAKFTEGLKKILNDKTLRESYSKKGLTRAMDFDITKMTEKWKTLILNLQNGN